MRNIRIIRIIRQTELQIVIEIFPLYCSNRLCRSHAFSIVVGRPAAVVFLKKCCCLVFKRHREEGEEDAAL